MQQLSFSINDPHYDRLFITAPSNIFFYDMAHDYHNWPHNITIFQAPHFAGKTCLAQYMVHYSNALYITPGTLREHYTTIPKEQLVIIDDADLIPQKDAPTLFYIMNHILSEGGYCAMLCHGNISNWHVTTKDIISRLHACPVITVTIPENNLRCDILIKILQQHAIAYSKKAVTMLINNSERDYASLAKLAHIIYDRLHGSPNKLTTLIANDIIESLNINI